MEYEVNNNTEEKRFELVIDGEVAFLTYNYFKDDLVLIHTEVPEALQGKGISVSLIKGVLKFAGDHKLKIVVYCPSVSKFVGKHPEYNYLVRVDHVADANQKNK